jgi:DNA-binding transcriptional ArsR family regulator
LGKEFVDMDLPTPRIEDVGLDAVLAALADPLRRGVVLDLLERPDEEHACASFDLPLAKSTRTHHWRVLRQAGLIRQRDAGNGSFVRLRRAELADRFPGLLDAIRVAHRTSP